MKDYVGQIQFKEAWDLDLDTAIGIFETLSDMCELNGGKMRHAIPVIIKRMVSHSTEIESGAVRLTKRS